MQGYSELVWFNDYFTFYPTLFCPVVVRVRGVVEGVRWLG